MRKALTAIAALLMAAMVHLLMRPVTEGSFGTEIDVYFATSGPLVDHEGDSSPRTASSSGPDNVECQSMPFEGIPHTSNLKNFGSATWIRCRLIFQSNAGPPAEFNPVAFLEEHQAWTMDAGAGSYWSSKGTPWAIAWTDYVGGSLLLVTLGYLANRAAAPTAKAERHIRSSTLVAAYVGVLAVGYALQTVLYGGSSQLGPRESSHQFLFLALVLAPVIEELFYRGWMLSILRTAWGDIPALVISSAVFAGVHLWSGTSILYIFGVAMALGAVKLKTNSVSACIVLHAAFNLAPLAIPLLFKP